MSYTAAQLGSFRIPQIENEPMRSYAPGSAERRRLDDAIAKMKKDLPFDVPCVINGKEIRSNQCSKQPLPSSHANHLCTYHKADAETVKGAIRDAVAAQKEWEAMPWNDRAAIFLKAADLIAGKYREQILAATILGQGKNAWQAEIDAAAELCDFLRFGVKYVEELYAQQPPKNAAGTWNRVEYRPLEGFVLAISPFNFTAIGGNLAAAPALVGNVVIWKPSPAATYSNYLVHKVFLEAGLPPSVIQFVPGDPEVVVKESLENREFASLHFTGSTAVFRQLWKQIGDGVGEGRYRSYPRIVGETGGKNFHLVHQSADVTNAVHQSVRSAFEYQGQKCSALSRLYVSASIWPEFQEKFVKEVANIKVGPSENWENFMGPVIGKPGFDKIVGYIEKAKQEGGEILCGGTADGSKGFFIQPTVILTKDPKSITMREEIFGPVVTVYVYQDEDLDQTLELINTTTDYALTGAIFAQDRSALIKTSNALRNAAGNMYYNEKCTGAVVGQQPFGGSRASGTNDKAGSVALFWRFVSARSIKEGFVGLENFGYPSNLTQKLTMKRIIVPLRVSNGIAVRLARPPQMALEPRLAELQTQLASADRLDEDPVLNIITRGLSDQEADWTLDDINAVISSSEDVELNALDLCPLLWQYIPENDGAIRLLNTITLKASSKECIIALQETQDTLSTKLSEWAQRDQEDDAGHQLVESLSLLLQLYENVIPRLMLRKKGPTETLSQLIRGINVVVQVGSTAADKKLGRRLLECLSKFITATARWVRSSPSTSDDEKSNCNDLLATLLFSGVGTCGSYIQAHNAERYLESHFSRRYLHSNVDNEAFQGQAIASVIIDSAKELKLRPKSLLKMVPQGGAIATACIVLIAHWPTDEYAPELQQLSILGPQIELLLQSNSELDECMFLLMSRANTPGELDVDALAQAMAALASSNPNPVLRNTAFVTLSLLVKKLAPPARLAFFSHLLSDENPFPQMRVAAVGLVKESVLEALSSTKQSILASNALFAQLGRFLLRPDPLDLFGDRFDPKEFLASSEPPRLVECLGFYYTLLQRDTLNKTGIRDSSSVNDTRRSLLEPLAGSLESLQTTADDDSRMSVIALQIALERVRDALPSTG